MRLTLLFVCIAGLTSGCGMWLDLDPPDDAGMGMDGSVRPACAEDSECDDGRVCNGIEICDDGVCVAGIELDCDDGIDCTRNRCRESAGGCVAEPQRDRCGDPTGCRSTYCDVDLGCRSFSDDSRCDDELHCTIDSCVDGSCQFSPDHERCAEGDYCSLDPTVGDLGCQPLPSECDGDSMCVALPCNDVYCSPDRRCQYSPLEADPTCTAHDECRPVQCEDGACVIGDPMDCEADDVTRCTSEVCQRDPEGAVTCVATPRTGRCSTTDCSAGSCNDAGLCEEAAVCMATSNRCQVAICSGGGCTTTPITCGANASCRPATGTCRCDRGFAPCGGDGECCSTTIDGGPIGMDAGSDAGRDDAGTIPIDDAGTIPIDDAGTIPIDDAGTDGGIGVVADAAPPACPPMRDDCDGTGGCECDLSVSQCSAGICVCQDFCGPGKICCPGGVRCAVARDCPGVGS